ncbi:A-kinase anchor protein 2-like [Megalops cyprinoides]|uniref:A-kinase anchor protein 2-like n=1 Tax=Megalops cyprinoides TaxID=118141 RepID=UPI001863CDB7|nr:A-kinase anchor protein 2-like [Megalops cyprinoides]XP_036381825.1 A-kinase anchor protein 2-like [Megalops cyprinoides]
MEMEVPFLEAPKDTSDTNSKNGFISRHDSLDSDAAKEIHYLDEVLDGNAYVPVDKMNSNGTSSSDLKANNTISGPSLVADMPPAYISKNMVEGTQIASTDSQDCYFRNPSDLLEMVSQDSKEPMLTKIKKAARFELRAFQEEKKPSKLFDSSSEKELIRVRKVRDPEEMEELERERQELIHSQAVKKNPGIAAKWWNPRQIKSVEEELDPDQLESHRKYEERKQRKPKVVDQASVKQSFVLVESVKEDVLIEEAGLSACQKELQLVEPTKHDDLMPTNYSFHLEEIDSGLDDLSLQSQDTAAQECLSNDFSMDTVSDSSVSNEAANALLGNSLGDYSLPASPQAPTTPVDENLDVGTREQSEPSMSPSSPGTTLEEVQVECQAEVQNTIQQSDDRQSLQAPKASFSVPERHEEEEHCEGPVEEACQGINIEGAIKQPLPLSEEKSEFDPLRVSSPGHEKLDIVPEVPTRTSFVHNDTFQPLTIGGSQAPRLGERQEFSYFSKYSEAAELRSTATLTRPQDAEVSSGPFRLRSHKRQTLSLIEEEIRATQQREEELKRQRQAQNPHPAPSHKERTTSLPTRLVVTGKTAPGKIEKIQCVSLTTSSSEGPSPSSLPDLGSDSSENGQRPKNFMQTLMEDYETHKVKRRDMMEDARVLEATRVTRRQSDMAIRWEAGIYTNQEEGSGYEEDAPPHCLSREK